jgi:Helix-turn-helix domain
MQGFYTSHQLADMLGGGESTYRLRAMRGEFPHASKQGGTWLIPLRDVQKWGRGYDKEFAEPLPLDPSHPKDESDIVLAQNNDGRYGIYINERWYGAGEALEILAYLEEHGEWLRQKAAENNLSSSEEEF